MAKYAILIYEDPAFYANASPEAWGAVIDAHTKFTKQVFELGGSLRGGAGAPDDGHHDQGRRHGDGRPVRRDQGGPRRLLRRRGARPRPRRRDRQAVPGPRRRREVRPVVDPTTNPF